MGQTYVTFCCLPTLLLHETDNRTINDFFSLSLRKRFSFPIKKHFKKGIALRCIEYIVLEYRAIYRW